MPFIIFCVWRLKGSMPSNLVHQKAPTRGRFALADVQTRLRRRPAPSVSCVFGYVSALGATHIDVPLSGSPPVLRVPARSSVVAIPKSPRMSIIEGCRCGNDTCLAGGLRPLSIIAGASMGAPLPRRHDRARSPWRIRMTTRRRKGRMRSVADIGEAPIKPNTQVDDKRAKALGIL